MLVMVVFFIVLRWIYLLMSLISLFLLVLFLLLIFIFYFLVVLFFFFVDAYIVFESDLKFFSCLVRFDSSSVPTTLPTAYDVYPLDGRHDGGYYTVKDCVTIDVLPRTPGNNVYVGFMVWSNFTATK